MAEVSSELSLFEALALDRRVDEYGTARYYTALGQLHRVYGPAIEYAGYRAWYINGMPLTEAAWLQVVANMENV